MRRRNRRANGAAAPAFVPLSKQHAAVTQPHAGDFDRRGHPVQHDDLVRPVELIRLGRRKPILAVVESTPEVRALPSAGITRPQRYHDPVRHPPRPSPDGDGEAATSARGGSPPITRTTVPACRAQLPRRIETGARVGCFPAPRGLPRFSAESASATSLSRPAQTSLALRPVGLLSRPRRPLSQGFSWRRTEDRAVFARGRRLVFGRSVSMIAIA
jgi:hypothetical protein